ncbi:MAG: T9SS type A sorting domain-containing protein [Phycisphaerae bacterium]|nr:T9SS type A sorting domain-containing protein [Saprospiraceae bacterium]
MIKKLLLGAFALILPCLATAQVYNGNVWLKDQASVDTFVQLTGGAREIFGNLFIGNSNPNFSDIHDLGPLSKLHVVWGNLAISNNPLLSNLHGLEQLDSAAVLNPFFSITNNDRLKNLDGLQNLHYVAQDAFGTLEVRFNDSLETLDGLDALHGYYDHIMIEGNPRLRDLHGLRGITESFLLWIKQNKSLRDLSGLDSLRSTSALWIQNCDSLESLHGLEQLTHIKDFALEHNAQLRSVEALAHAQTLPLGVIGTGNILIIDCDALEYLTGMGGFKKALVLDILDNENLRSVAGLSGMEYASSRLNINDNPRLRGVELPSLWLGSDVNIRRNASLQNLDGLINLDSILGEIFISDNDSLTSLEGLANLRSVGGCIAIDSCDGLTRLDGFHSLYITGCIEVKDNDRLEEVAPFENLIYLRYITGSGNGGPSIIFEKDSSLINLHLKLPKYKTTLGVNFPNIGGIGINNCPKLEEVFFDTFAVKAHTSIFFNENINLQRINLFKHLDTLGGLSIFGCTRQIDIVGLSDQGMLLSAFSLGYNDSITAVPVLPPNTISLYYEVAALNNPLLSDLSALSGLQALKKGDLIVQKNPALSNLHGLEQLQYIGDEIFLRDNLNLTDCSALCPLFKTGQILGANYISGNPFPCDTKPHIKGWCDTLTIGNVSPDQGGLEFALFPNPTQEGFTLVIPEDCGEGDAVLWGSNGIAVWQQQFLKNEQKIRVDLLPSIPSGVYWLSVRASKGVGVRKVLLLR